MKVKDATDLKPEHATKAQALAALDTLRHFIGAMQLAVVRDAMRGEERQYFFDLAVSLAHLTTEMPKIYAQDGLGDQAIVYLHYFQGGMDWFITERDLSDDQPQAFGLADFGDGGELGYISITELIGFHVELDFHFAPRTLAAVRARKEAS